MAEEILVIDLVTAERGARVRYVFLHTIEPPIKTSTNVLVIPTPASEMPEDFAALELLQSPQTKNDLNAGVLGFEIDTLYISQAEIGRLSDVRTKLRRAYAASTFVERLRQRYKFTGVTLDAS